MAIDKDFYRQQVGYTRQRLETLYKLIDLNPIQIQELRKETTALVEASVKEAVTPEVVE